MKTDIAVLLGKIRPGGGLLYHTLVPMGKKERKRKGERQRKRAERSEERMRRRKGGREWEMEERGSEQVIVVVT